MARSLAYLFAAGATISLLPVLLPNDGSVDSRRLLIQSVGGYAIAALLGAGGGRLPRWSFQVFLAAATMLVEWTIYASSDSTSPFAAFYFWIAIYAFHFFNRRQAVAQVTFIVAAYAALFAVVPDPGSTPVLRWAITMSALVVAGAMIGILQDRVARLGEEVRTDSSTGLLNRRGFYEALTAEVERARRSGAPLAVAIARIDGYRGRIERADEDPSLIQIGELLCAGMRTTDTAARISVDEVAVIAPGSDEHGAYLIAERLRRTVRGAFAGTERQLTLSIGVAAFPIHAATAEAVMHAAEQGVLAAEQLGHDRTVIYNPEIASLVLAAETRRQGGSDGNLAAVLALTEVLDIRDAGTAVHSQTVGRYAEAIARELGFSPELVERVRLAGILHDVGKIAVPDAVLRKPGPLNDEEFDQMRRHPEVGALIVDGADLKDVAAWVMAHHERPDGRGYPKRLSGDEIPLEARILAVADSYEAMTVDRVYRKALGAEKARAELERCAGTQFDPRVVEVFLAVLERGGLQGMVLPDGSALAAA
jgi:diguanylate cyclase (GGDEF)-like protein/putative nucleotidyltransferase with HDIG domain